MDEQEHLKYEKKEQTIRFMSFMIEQFNMIKASKRHMTVMAVQPGMGELTYLMHPMCYAIYGLFYYEELVKDAKRRRERRYEDEP